jgi:hypothetical protein
MQSAKPIRTVRIWPATTGGTIWILLELLAVSAGGHAQVAQVQNQIFGAGYTPPWTFVAPGQVLTLTVAPALNVPDAVATETPLPTTLSGVSVLVRAPLAKDTRGYPTSLPILRVYTPTDVLLLDGLLCSDHPNVVGSPVCSNTQITVQIPTEPVCEPIGAEEPASCFFVSNFLDNPALLLLNVKANGTTGPDFPVQMLFRASAPHLLNSCDSIFGPPSTSPCHALVTHGDGTLVSNSSPAKVGETISLYGAGIAGCQTGAACSPTGSAPSAPTKVLSDSVLFTYKVSGPPPGSLSGSSTILEILVPPDWAGLIPGYVGLYQINVTVPPMPATVYPCGYTSPYGAGNGNAKITIPFYPGNSQVADPGTLYICVQP